MRAIEIIAGHVIYNPAYTYKFQLKTTNHSVENNKLGFTLYFQHTRISSKNE